MGSKTYLMDGRSGPAPNDLQFAGRSFSRDRHNLELSLHDAANLGRRAAEAIEWVLAKERRSWVATLLLGSLISAGVCSFILAKKKDLGTKGKSAEMKCDGKERRKEANEKRIVKRTEEGSEKHRNLEMWSAKELLSYIGRKSGVLERRELVELAGIEMNRRKIMTQVFGCRELSEQILRYLDVGSALQLSVVDKSCFAMANADVYWREIALPRLAVRLLPRLSQFDAELCVLALKDAFDHGFFLNDKHGSLRIRGEVRKGWKQFLGFTSLLEIKRKGGYGNAVVVPREEICPHHISRFVHMLSIRKHPQCAVPAFVRFLSLYSRLNGSLNLRGNVGFCFPLEGGESANSKRRKQSVGQESISHSEFMEMARASNLQIRDLVEFFHSQAVLREDPVKRRIENK